MTNLDNPSGGRVASAPAAAAAKLRALYEKRREDRLEKRYDRKVLLFLLAHPVLAMLMKASSLVPTAHALATLGTGLYWLLRGRNPDRVIPLMGYIVGSEILWRGTGARIPWEFAKYSLCLLSVVALVRFSLLKSSSKAPLLYFLLLTPSILVMTHFDREAVSFNLSGPVALALTTCFLSTRRLDRTLFKGLLLGTLAPLIGLAALATFSTLTTANIQFGASSRATSAGIGPNQASSALGLGALLAFFYLVVDRRQNRLRWFLLGAGLWLGGQCALTFSRGGLITFLGAFAAGCFFLLQDQRSRGAMLIRSAFAAVFVVYLFFPALNAFTGGAMADRFTSTHLTGRDKIIQGDLLAYRENPLLGTGPGGSKIYHAMVFRFSSAHTEYSRVLAEHGSAGLLALLILFGISAGRALRRAPPVSKAFAAAMTTWALLYMIHSAMRLAAPSLMFALGGVLVFLEAPAQNLRMGLSERTPRFVPGPGGSWQRAGAVETLLPSPPVSPSASSS